MGRVVPKEIDWSFVIQGKGKRKPSAVFKPGNERREIWISILTERPRKSGYTMKSRQKLEAVLQEAFELTYTRYRRQVQPRYRSPYGEEKRHCREAARHCIICGVTPFQLLRFWHDRIGSFTGMKYPPVSFIAKHSRVDEVAAHLEDGGKLRARPPKRGVKDTHHGFSDTSKLNPELRIGLTAAGFDLSEWPDRFLVSVQSLAADIRAGHRDGFISAEMKPLVDWAVANLGASESGPGA